MATQHTQGGAPALPATAPILAMHERYEAAWNSQEAIETANFRARREGGETFHLEQAERMILREIDGLRLSILYQVPQTQTEALILTHHVESTYDLVQEGSASEVEREAVSAATAALLDFMCRSASEGISGLGGMILASADRVRSVTQKRQGRVEQ